MNQLQPEGPFIVAGGIKILQPADQIIVERADNMPGGLHQSENATLFIFICLVTLGSHNHDQIAWF